MSPEKTGAGFNVNVEDGPGGQYTNRLNEDSVLNEEGKESKNLLANNDEYSTKIPISTKNLLP